MQKDIYTLLENDITVKFYKRNKEEVPEDWVEMIKNNHRPCGP